MAAPLARLGAAAGQGRAARAALPPAPDPHLSGRLESGHTRKRSRDGSSGCGRPGPGPCPASGSCPCPCPCPLAARPPAATLRSTAAAARRPPPPPSMAAHPGRRFRRARQPDPGCAARSAALLSGAGAAVPGAMGVSGLAGVVRGRDGMGRRRAVPGALQRRRQDPLPAQHRGLLPPGLRPRVVPQPGKGPAGRPQQPRGGGEPAPG